MGLASSAKSPANTQKLIATDLDGTLVFNHQISQADIDSIERWQAAGFGIATATGKSVESAQNDLGSSGIKFDYQMLNTGALIMDGAYRVLWSTGIPFDLVAEVVSQKDPNNGVGLYATTVTSDYEIVGYQGTFRNPELLEHFRHTELETFKHEECLGLVFAVPDEADGDAVYADVVRRYGDVLDCHRNLSFIDITPKGSDKGVGIDRLKAIAFRDTPVEVFTLGDSWNDLAMHAKADVSVTFDYAPLEVQQHCDVVVPNFHTWVNAYLDELGV